MTLLQIIATMNPAQGGPQENLTQISRALARLGHVTDIATLDAPTSTWGSELGEVFRFGPARLGNYGYSESLHRWLRESAARYDGVIVHGLWQYHGLACWRALAGSGVRSGVPYYVFSHGMLDPWFRRRFPLKHLKKQLYWNCAEYRVLRDAKAVLFTCEEERLLARQSFSRYQVNEAVVGCGIREPEGDASEQRESFWQQFPRLRDKRLLLFLGRLHPKKGCENLLEALAEAAPLDPRLHLAMVGPGDETYVAALTNQAARLGIADRICWAGMLRGDAKWGAFRASEAFVLPSHQENFGISVAEALACGVPVLISNKVNIWREIEAGHAGLVEDDTAAGTTRLLKNWLCMPASQRERMASLAQTCFRTHFHIDATTRRLLDTLEPMARKRAPCTPPQMSAA